VRKQRARPGRLPDPGELASIGILGIMAVWGIWFGVQSITHLWWPLNAAYMAAGLTVAVICIALARAVLNR
jgi:Na+/H+-dicarboxylate symporter